MMTLTSLLTRVKHGPASLKVIACLGNPGPEHSTTRHNVGWWLADRLAQEWGLGRFRRRGPAAVALGKRDGLRVEIIKPMTYMNRSGSVLAPLRGERGFDIGSDLLVVVDDVALEPGRARFRAAGSAGGHNGLKSVEASLATREYARLRIGVGEKPARMELADWVLAPPPKRDRDAIIAVIPELVGCIGVWAADGIEAAMNRCNGI